MTGKARWGALGVLVFACLVAAGVAVAQARTGSRGLQTAAVDPSCQLNSAKGNIKHVIYIQFDNTHFRRDNANVPSDLEQMPHLLNFMRGNGTLMTNDHTALISHTATGILSSLTGVYPDRMGQPVSNSYRYFSGTGSRTGVSFAYWTAPVFDPAGTPATGADTTPTMINENGKIAPAPWVPYTRAGCDFGAVATANTILENTAIDIPTVFGANSPEAAEVASNPRQAFADFVGIGVHCAQGSALCSTANNGRPDLLPDEPGGYSGFNGLFGAKYVDPQISPNGPMTDLNGNVIQDASGHIGFPGFDGMEATVSLSWVAHMQEAGIPVTYAYISDAHDGHGTAGNIHFAYGPGEAGYVQQLKDYDLAFQRFFDRLAADGINKSNTLFAFTVDEGDHFVGDAPTPAGCDGVNTPCTYNRVGEINADLRRMVRTQFGDTTPFSVHSDDAPTVYINGNPAQTDPVTRKLERETANLSGLNPYTNTFENNIMVAQADRTEMKTLHMVTADPLRTPTYTPFADPDWFFFATGGPDCSLPPACITIPARTSQSFAWNHGDIQDEIASTWVGYVGPGVKNDGDFTGWTDHTDVRPTMLSLLGLNDDYLRDGRPVTQVLDSGSVPATLQSSDAIALGDMLKRLDAPFGEFGMNTLKASSIALASDTNHDNRYTTIEKSIASLTDQRDQVVDAIKAQLAGAETGTAVDHTTASDLLDRAQGLLGHAAGLGH
jgi:predicted transcriptional regulator